MSTYYLRLKSQCSGNAVLTCKIPLAVQSKREELANAITHGVGFVLSVPVVFLLLFLAFQDSIGQFYRTGCIVYSLSLLMLFLCSTIYHSVTNTAMKNIFRRVDHICVCIFIAASYHVFLYTFVNLRVCIALLTIMWIITALWVMAKAFCFHEFRLLSVAGYLVLGWILVATPRSVLTEVEPGAFWWLLAGGILYSTGVLFFVGDESVPYFHCVWHLFVLLGSAAHLVMVCGYAIPFAAAGDAR